jgi:predicted metal-dependent hydrolase
MAGADATDAQEAGAQMRLDAQTTEMLPVGGVLTAVAFRRSARARKISLRIDPGFDGILITLPMRVSHRQGLALLRQHEDWAAEKLAALPRLVRIAAGVSIPVDGVMHGIVPVPDGRGGAWIGDGQIFVTGEPEFLARRVTDCLKRRARQKFTALAAEKAALAGAKINAVRIKDTRTRWGSCAPDGTLAFCWRLVCAPEFVQDYVVAHEVAHLRHMNHGRQFWALTETLTLHRAIASDWLARNGLELLRLG